MLSNLVFYNNYHNGDVHYGRGFIINFAKHIPAQRKWYIHNKHIKTSLGVLEYRSAPQMPMEAHVFKNNNDLFINCWIGADHRKFLTDGVTMEGNYAKYIEAAKHIKDIIGVSVPIEPIDHYIPEIDFNLFNVSRIDSFFAAQERKIKVFVVNSDVMSGQSSNFDFDPIIGRLADTYPNVLFILSNKKSLLKDNVVYASDINGVHDGCDLCENAYISKKCNVIVGRGSGSFCFSCIKDNWLDESKSILGIGYRRKETLWHDTKNCSFTDNFSEDNVYNSIETLIRKYS